LKTNQKKARSFLDSEIEKFGFSSKELLDDDFRLLDWKQLKQIASSNLVDFGSHTKSHIPLAGLSKTKIKPELFSSKSEIERKLQRDCFSFAYPFGSFDDSAVKEAQKLFFFSFTTQFGEALLDSNRALLPRISLNNNYNSLFPATVSIDLPGIHSAAYKKILALNKNKRLV
jgi:peptidoglycan/xylan/chitin deacetylase (PgdA/CDA1 family)